MYYVERELVKVTDKDGIKYFAVDEDTLENMDDTSRGMQYIVDDGTGKYQDAQFTVEWMGKVQVSMEYPDPY